jgi:L-ascorbate metabolism protein UlaG (beta-lactamase superfamily)
MPTAVVVVTCEACGQSWHRSTVTAEQRLECVFCGEWGRLRVGPTQVDAIGVQHVEARLQPLRSAPS